VPDLSRIPRTIRGTAFQIISDQTFVPRSPLVKSNDGSLQLCLAAALVVAAVEEERRGAVIDRFDAEGRDAVVESFGELGWGKQLGLVALTTNDAFNETERKAAVLRLLADSTDHADK
jgi:hypothetical protein